jgi:hypothetical protein
MIEEKLIRKCSKCHIEKELNIENFYFLKNRAHRGILSCFRKECRPCYNIYMRVNTKKNNSKNTANKERKKEWDRKYNEKMKVELTDRYIVKLLKRDDKTINVSDLKKNKELIELYRLRLIFKRGIKNDSATK